MTHDGSDAGKMRACICRRAGGAIATKTRVSNLVLISPTCKTAPGSRYESGSFCFCRRTNWAARLALPQVYRGAVA